MRTIVSPEEFLEMYMIRVGERGSRQQSGLSRCISDIKRDPVMHNSALSRMVRRLPAGFVIEPKNSNAHPLGQLRIKICTNVYMGSWVYA